MQAQLRLLLLKRLGGAAGAELDGRFTLDDGGPKRGVEGFYFNTVDRHRAASVASGPN